MQRYITTPIYYVNDRPHIGHCYTTLVADCMARFERLRGTGPVFFLTGTDEHADKVVTSAQANGMTAIQWADRNAAEFAKAFAFINASNDDFIRTTQDRHKTRVIEYVSAMIKSGAIYPGTYEGWYDENQEEYLTETVAKDQDYKSSVTGKPLVRRSEKCYFFKLSAYQSRLEKHFADNPTFVQPDARRNEVLGRLRDGLNDVPISRPVTDDPATQFGIRVPGDEQHRIYVWIDALFNYLSVVDTDDRRTFWPSASGASTCTHFIAKDILWFHAVIWPAMLMALRDTAAHGTRFDFVGLPTTVYSHAYWVREGRKMSKSLKNFIEIEQLQAYANKFSLDAVRWYLLTQGPLNATDADFSHSKFVEVYNADLANGIGNCTSRVGNMIEKYFGTLPDPTKIPESDALNCIPLHVPEAQRTTWREFFATIRNRLSITEDAGRIPAVAFDVNGDMSALHLNAMNIVRTVDDYISKTAPFKLAKTVDQNPAAKDQLAAILYNCAEALRIASILLSPAMPQKMAQVWHAWNCTPPANVPLAELCEFAGKHALKPGQTIAKGEVLFMRADTAEAAPA
ncbi:MAG TPA: methionine--tRNA ligase [Phycisphaerales bacterium]|nr:methionine--tRNA ligase [Phycisphaerales bacterium]